MAIMIRWYRRIAAVLAAAVLGVLVPATAWAHTNPVAVAVGDDLARRRVGRVGRGGGFLGLLGTLCCLFVVVVIVLTIVMITRRRRR